MSGPLECLCACAPLELLHRYTAPPEGEVRFPFSSAGYRRELWRCRDCAHVVSRHEMDISAIYGGQYIDSTYGDDAGMHRAFERIMALPGERSDNSGRVQRVCAYARRHFGPEPPSPLTVLDIGAGLCVFLARMKAEGWRGTAVDPDPRAVQHARERVGVEAFRADFVTEEISGRWDAVTFNKVLEHVLDPVTMLARALPLLRSGGFVYIELPDAEGAWSEGPGREEFFVEHHHVFSAASVCLLAQRAGFTVVELERLREPSSKLTLRAFLVRASLRPRPATKEMPS